MDFTQHNKINSVAPKKFQNRSQSYIPNYPPQMQNFPSQTRTQFQNINHPCSSPISKNQFGHGNQNYFPQRSGGDMSQSFMQKPASFNQQTYSLDSGMNYASNSCQQSELQYREHEQHQSQEEEQPSDEDEVNIEYFQCSPSPSNVVKHQSPFKPVMQSMRQFSMTKPVSKCHQHAEANHQTFMFTHDDEEVCEETTNFAQQKLYRSHTRIVSIPNGVKIVTEILKEDNDTSTDSDESSSNPNQVNDDEWMNKQIEVSVDGVGSKELIENDFKN